MRVDKSGDVCEWSAAVGWGGPQCPTGPVESRELVSYDSAGRLYSLSPTGGDPQHVFYFAGRPIATYTGGPMASYSLLTTDHLGTPVLAFGLDGLSQWVGGFEPFGRDFTIPSAASQGIFLRLPGQWNDGLWNDGSLGTELNYNVHRWYETQTGRYARVDPLGLEDDAWSLYSYALQNPLGNLDPLGLASLAPFQKCKGFDRAIGKLQKLKDKCECTQFFRSEFGAELIELIDGPLPQVEIVDGPGSASTPCGQKPGYILIDPGFCRLGGRGNLPHVILHELAHFADCSKQKYPPGGPQEEGILAELACFGKSIDRRAR